MRCLYHLWLSPFCRKVRLVLGEKGLDFDMKVERTWERRPEFLAINPNGRLPVIEDDGFVLFESLAITLYLAKKHSNGRLYPGTLQGEAKAWQWTLWAVTEVDRGVNIPEGLVIGEDPEFDGKWFRRTDDGVVLITQPMIDRYLASR